MKKPDTYLFPAVFTFEEGHEIAVTFPDLPGCTTSGANEAESLKMAKEALGGHLYCMEEDDDEIPAPSLLREVAVNPNEHAILVEAFMPSIRLAQVNRAVNRTVTLPAWLNAVALEKEVNFSQLLQEAIKEKLHIGEHAS